MGQVSKIIAKVTSLDKNEKKLLAIYLGIWAFFHFILWASAGYSIRQPLEYFGNYAIIVIMPTTLLGTLYTVWMANRHPSAIPKSIRQRLNKYKGRETLKKRVEGETWVTVMNGLEDRLILFVLMPLTYKLTDLFPSSARIKEWVISVHRRYLVIDVAQAISYPRKPNGYFLRIIDYLWNPTHATFKLCPTIGTAKAMLTISKRISAVLHKPVKQIRYQTEGNYLYVSVPLTWVLPKES